jgi:hypothetical protein
MLVEIRKAIDDAPTAHQAAVQALLAIADAILSEPYHEGNEIDELAIELTAAAPELAGLIVAKPLEAPAE